MASKPTTTETGTDSEGRAWCQMTVKLNMGNYESVEISMGGTLPCGPTSAAVSVKHRQLMTRIESALSAKAEEVRELWGNTGGHSG